jgi:hypothetical protein
LAVEVAQTHTEKSAAALSDLLQPRRVLAVAAAEPSSFAESRKLSTPTGWTASADFRANQAVNRIMRVAFASCAPMV